MKGKLVGMALNVPVPDGSNVDLVAILSKPATPEAINQAYGAAGRVLTLLANDTVIASGSVCDVTQEDCVACGACITACTYDAIEFVETPKGKKAWVNPILCKGDGLCNAKCPTNAIVVNPGVG